MFAAATREVVFANPEIVRRVNREFIPVALKAAMVNNPPPGIEGELYAQIGRTKPAPQGICTTDSDGNVLTWALSFDDDISIAKFLDHVLKRFREKPTADEGVVAERYRKFPSRKLADLADDGRRVQMPPQHSDRDPCPATPGHPTGTLVGTIIGRALDDAGEPLTDVVHQEHYMEARLQIGTAEQNQLADAAQRADGKQFLIPDPMVRALVDPAYLGQLDVNPSGTVPGSSNRARSWKFVGQQKNGHKGALRIRVEGSSDIAGGQSPSGNRSDGRIWDHRVTLRWYGFIDLRDGKITNLAMLAAGDEQLRWGSEQLRRTSESAAEHLMAGHAIDLDCGVRYGLVARSGNDQ